MYSFFFSDTASRLLDCSFGHLTIGADEEQVMRKAMSHAFQGVLQVTCTCHLQSNSSDQVAVPSAVGVVQTYSAQFTMPFWQQRTDIMC